MITLQGVHQDWEHFGASLKPITGRTVRSMLRKPSLPVRQKSHHLLTNHCSPSPGPTVISDLVLTHSGDAASLSRRFPGAAAQWPPSLPDLVLKRLWNDGPRALLFFDALLHLPHRPSPSTFAHAIDIAARLRDHRSLRRLLSLHPLSLRTFSILAERYTSAGHPDRAVRLFLSLPRPQSLSSFNILLDVLCKSRHIKKATSLFHALRRRLPPDAITYNILADGWCRRKRTPQALSILRDMVEDGISPTLTTYNTILHGFFKAGQVREALQFFSQMKKRARNSTSSASRPDVISYTTVVHGLGLAGQLDNARKMLDEMTHQGCMPTVATYNALIQGICKKGCVDNAVLVFDEMERKGCTPNSVTYNLVIRGLCHRGEMERAMEFVERMKRDGCEPNVQTYTMLIRYWCEEGEIEKGLELFGKMVEPGGCLPNLDTYNVVISSMFVRKRPEDMVAAGKMVMDMVQRGHLPRRFMFNRVLNGLLVTGNQRFAKELLRMQDQYGRLHREFRL